MPPISRVSAMLDVTRDFCIYEYKLMMWVSWSQLLLPRPHRTIFQPPCLRYHAIAANRRDNSCAIRSLAGSHSDRGEEITSSLQCTTFLQLK